MSRVLMGLARQIRQWHSFAPMKFAVFFCAMFLFGLLQGASAQTSGQNPGKSGDANQLEALAKKIDEQNVKIDALSQEILKLEQQIAHIRPGVMIGESTPPATSSAAVTSSAPHPAGANTHTVARGETLTSIAKMYKVSIEELQNANHIEDGRKLQAGQTIIIPVASPAASGSPSPTE
jgi:LysM repeat protein